MRKGGGKGKGSSFEREICVALSKWLTNGKNVDCFWRSAMSGGRATVAKGTVRQAGDITAVAPEGHILTDHYYIECKNYKDLSLDCLIKGKGTLLTFWQTTQKEAAKYNRHPILIFKRNHWPTMVCMAALGVLEFGIKDLVCLNSPTFDMHFIHFDELIKIPFPLP